MLHLGGGLAEGSPEAEKAVADILEMYGFFVQCLEERRAAPRDDFMSTVAALEMDGEPLAEASQAQICFSILAAGNETTRNTISGSMVAFAEHPDQWQKLLADPSLSRSATDELLRWVTPVIHFGRRATEPVQIRDQKIADGDFVVMLYGSGNRDEEVWPDADVFDISRTGEQKHLSFGWGLHFCIGAALGRAETRVTLEALSERFSGWEIAGQLARHPSTLVNDYTHVPVVLNPR
jgi:cytochrome P450